MNQKELLVMLEENGLEAIKFGQTIDVKRFGHTPVDYVLFKDTVLLVQTNKRRHYYIYQANKRTFNEFVWPINNLGFMSLSNKVDRTVNKKELTCIDDAIVVLRRMLA